MQNRLQPYQRYFASQFAVFKTLDCLPTRDLLVFAQLSKKAHDQVAQYLTVRLKAHGFIDDSQDRIANPFYTYSEYFGREVILIPLPKQFSEYCQTESSIKKLNFIKRNVCKGLPIKDFSMGIKFTAYHLYTNEIVIMRTRDFKG